MSRSGVAIVGGGPAGLYLSILLRMSQPDLEVTVFERNSSQDAYGFGVVFSDETIDHFEKADPESYEAMARAFRRWGEIKVRHPEGRELVSGGHGFSAISRRTLLEILTDRAKGLGVDLHFSTEVSDSGDFRWADVVVAADGANSLLRRQLASHLRPSVEPARNKYIWFGTPKVFDEFNFIFEDTAAGMVWAHIYPYGDEGSTFIVEMPPETWAALGFDATVADESTTGLSDERALRGCEEIFAAHLEGSPLRGNNSRWLQFPTVACERWHHGNVVLMGDAVHTAHFSVGSGTKLAMEDAIALARLLVSEPDHETAFEQYEENRRPEVESLQRAARASRSWFEGADRYRGMPPEQFVFSMLTRSQRITYDNLRLRDPVYMAAVDSWYASSEHRSPYPVGPEVPPMFHPFVMRGMVLPNRIVVSPMDQYSASDGVPNEWHLVHLGSRAVGGAGLVMTEMTCVSPEGRISPGCTGLWNEDQAAAFARIVDFVHDHTSSRIGLQIGHSGRKGSTKFMWEGDSDPLDVGNWEIMAPSPIRYRPDSQVPREMTDTDMDRVRDEHVVSARLGAGVGFDMLELHFAHGYLLSSFLTPLANQRGDRYGGSLENRMRYPLEVFAAVREAWPDDRPISVRISATDWVDGGFDGDDAVVFAQALKELGCDLIDVSTGQTTIEAAPEYGRLYQTPYSDRIRNEVGIATMTVGAVSSIDDVHNILVAGRADLCLLARPHIVDPYWTLNAAIDLAYTGHAFPDQYLAGLGSRRREQDPIAPDVFRRPNRP
ncbi:MAG TPA: bifunctional salicylyl-CoA 5-hydroxylase/oxidoreductase [Acidimicrobiia bacterium]|nr:bifunctional salicylyl-CoA 5-hydroxylase/oxidoreductase [Acidimicrobiia bacterium]